MNQKDDEFPESGKSNKAIRAVLQTAGGVLPYVGGLISAAAGAWSEGEQEKVNEFFKHWIKMLEDELKEKEETIIDILARLNLQDEKISSRVYSPEYQSLMKKTFREWSGAESAEKRKYIRNILSNAAQSDVSSDDVVRLFIDWIGTYSELHFKVIAAIYNNNGITRGQIWSKIGQKSVREDSAEADLYKLLFRDLSTGGIIRQHRQTDYHGNFVQKAPAKKSFGSDNKTMKSAFDNEEQYELTALGKQFIHYAMTELSMRISYEPPVNDSEG